MNETQHCVQMYAHLLFRAERWPQVSSTSTNNSELFHTNSASMCGKHSEPNKRVKVKEKRLYG